MTPMREAFKIRAKAIKKPKSPKGTKRCPICEQRFQTGTKGKRFCSTKCSDISHRANMRIRQHWLAHEQKIKMAIEDLYDSFSYQDAIPALDNLLNLLKM